MVLATGRDVPEISATNQHGDRVTLTFDGPTVLFFYPENGTPGCTQEAEQFELERESYEEAGVRAVGVSTDEVEDHREFAEELGLQFTLLADPDGEICDALGVERDEGRAARTTVVVVDGVVHRIYEDVTPDGHARQVLMDLLEDGVVELPEP